MIIIVVGELLSLMPPPGDLNINFKGKKKFLKNHWRIKIMLGLGEHQSAFI